jgi:ABC-2 type transport system ATP-binding protein
MLSIKVTDLTKKYGGFTALDSVNFEVEQGDFYGFIGPNGAGKTTTIKTMLNLLNPYTGQVSLLGKDIKLNQFQSDIGYVPGEAYLYDNLRVGKQIDYFSQFFDHIDKTYLRRLKEMFQVTENKKISQLSLGNKKKVAIVCALMNKPKILFFDEVSNSLDPLMQKVLFDELHRLCREGVTIFFSSHNLEEVQRYCKNVAIIRGGKIVNIDSVEKIVNSFGVQVYIKAKTQLPKLFFVTNKIKPTIHSDGSASFIYKEDINKLLRAVSMHKLEYLRISDVKLEDIFEEYYEGEDR